MKDDVDMGVVEAVVRRHNTAGGMLESGVLSEDEGEGGSLLGGRGSLEESLLESLGGSEVDQEEGELELTESMLLEDADGEITESMLLEEEADGDDEMDVGDEEEEEDEAVDSAPRTPERTPRPPSDGFEDREATPRRSEDLVMSGRELDVE